MKILAMMTLLAAASSNCEHRTCTQKCMDEAEYKALDVKDRADVCLKVCHVVCK